MMDPGSPDFTAMDVESLKSYYITLYSTLKKTQEKRDEYRENLQLWEKRISLASTHNRNDLKAKASERAVEIREQMESLEREITQF